MMIRWDLQLTWDGRRGIALEIGLGVLRQGRHGTLMIFPLLAVLHPGAHTRDFAKEHDGVVIVGSRLLVVGRRRTTVLKALGLGMFRNLRQLVRGGRRRQRLQGGRLCRTGRVHSLVPRALVGRGARQRRNRANLVKVRVLGVSTRLANRELTLLGATHLGDKLGEATKEALVIVGIEIGTFRNSLEAPTVYLYRKKAGKCEHNIPPNMVKFQAGTKV